MTAVVKLPIEIWRYVFQCLLSPPGSLIEHLSSHSQIDNMHYKTLSPARADDTPIQVRFHGTFRAIARIEALILARANMSSYHSCLQGVVLGGRRVPISASQATHPATPFSAGGINILPARLFHRPPIVSSLWTRVVDTKIRYSPRRSRLGCQRIQDKASPSNPPSTPKSHNAVWLHRHHQRHDIKLPLFKLHSLSRSVLPSSSISYMVRLDYHAGGLPRSATKLALILLL